RSRSESMTGVAGCGRQNRLSTQFHKYRDVLATETPRHGEKHEADNARRGAAQRRVRRATGERTTTRRREGRLFTGCPPVASACGAGRRRRAPALFLRASVA